MFAIASFTVSTALFVTVVMLEMNSAQSVAACALVIEAADISSVPALDS